MALTWINDIFVQLPVANAIITNLQDPTAKKKRSRVRTKPGRPLTFYEIIAKMMDARELTVHAMGGKHGPGRSVYLWPQRDHEFQKVVSLMWLSCQPIRRVWEMATTGQIAEVEYLDDNPPCRCKECDRAKVKKPRGPKREKDGTIKFESISKYRGAGTFEDMQRWQKLCPDLRDRFERPTEEHT